VSGGYSEAELKARALREAANDIRVPDEWPDVDPPNPTEVATWLERRADAIEQDNDPAIPPEPMEAGSRLRCRNGDVYLRWCTGTSHTSSPWTDPGGHLEDCVRYTDLDVVEVFPAEALPS
jgi:hypothetical protein